jgi:hypothetical protein
MDKETFRRDMSNAFTRVGYGRLKKKENAVSESINQTGYGTPVAINPETINLGEGRIATVSPGEPIVSKETLEKYEEYLASKEENTRESRYRIQEAKRAPKVQVDQKFVLLAWIIGVGIAFVSSAIVSFNGITSVAQFVGLSAQWMAGLFFFFIELMYLIFLIAYLVLSSRVDDDGKPEKTGGALWGMIAFGGIAVLANAFHTLDYWSWNITNPQVWAGVILSIAAPIAIISASKMASRVVFAKAIKL